MNQFQVVNGQGGCWCTPEQVTKQILTIESSESFPEDNLDQIIHPNQVVSDLLNILLAE